MSDIQVIKGVAIPPRTRTGGRKNLYPWDILEVGDHFIFPEKTKKTTASSLSYRAGKISGKQFSIRVHTDGIKCWRTA